MNVAMTNEQLNNFKIVLQDDLIQERSGKYIVCKIKATDQKFRCGVTNSKGVVM